MSYKKVSFSTLGFTLIELLITIAIVGIIAVVAFVALDPARRFAEARNATRWTDVTGVLDAIKLYTVDQRGTLPWPTTGVPGPANRIAENGIRYMIGTCNNAVAGSECFGGVPAVKVCAGAPTGSVNGVYGIDMTTQLTGGTPAYLASLPINQATPNTATWSAVRTGYYLIQNANGGTEIGACDEEVLANITVTK